jgi:hypothetical protein
VEKYGRDWEATEENTAPALFMLDNWGYTHTLRMLDTYCFSTATVVTRKLLIIAFLRTFKWSQLETVLTHLSLWQCKVREVILLSPICLHDACVGTWNAWLHATRTLLLHSSTILLWRMLNFDLRLPPRLNEIVGLLGCYIALLVVIDVSVQSMGPIFRCQSNLRRLFLNPWRRDLYVVPKRR